MKKIILFFVLMGAFAHDNQAQGLYIGTGLGYGFNAGSTVLNYNYNADGSVNVIKGSLGAGTTPALSVGYLFTRTIGAEFSVGYLIGHKVPFENDYSYSNTSAQVSSSKMRTNSFYMNHSIVIRANASKVIPYAKIGLFIGILNNSKEKGTYTTTSSSTTTVTNGEFQFSQKGHMATGITSAFGLDFMLSDKFAVFGELTGRLASWSPDSYTSSSTVDPTGSYYVTTNSTTSISGQYVTTVPAKYVGPNRPAQVIPLSAIGFNVGMKIYLKK
jgi:hypothetical protein